MCKNVIIIEQKYDDIDRSIIIEIIKLNIIIYYLD